VLDTRQIPLKLTLAPSEVVAVTAPPPVYVRYLPRVLNAAHHAMLVLRQCPSEPLHAVQVMVPRLGYLPTIAAQVQQYFQVRLQQCACSADRIAPRVAKVPGVPTLT